MNLAALTDEELEKYVVPETRVEERLLRRLANIHLFQEERYEEISSLQLDVANLESEIIELEAALEHKDGIIKLLKEELAEARQCSK